MMDSLTLNWLPPWPGKLPPTRPDSGIAIVASGRVKMVREVSSSRSSSGFPIHLWKEGRGLTERAMAGRCLFSFLLSLRQSMINHSSHPLPCLSAFMIGKAELAPLVRDLPRQSLPDLLWGRRGRAWEEESDELDLRERPWGQVLDEPIGNLEGSMIDLTWWARASLADQRMKGTGLERTMWSGRRALWFEQGGAVRIGYWSSISTAADHGTTQDWQLTDAGWRVGFVRRVSIHSLRDRQRPF